MVIVDPEAFVNGEVEGVDVARLFTGYSGWAAGQLDAELDLRHVAHRAAAARRRVLLEPEQLWRSVMRRQGGRLARRGSTPTTSARTECPEPVIGSGFRAAATGSDASERRWIEFPSARCGLQPWMTTMRRSVSSSTA